MQRGAAAPATLVEAMVIEALFEGGEEWYAGMVSAIQADGTYDIMYDDGDQEVGVPRGAIRLPGSGQPAP